MDTVEKMTVFLGVEEYPLDFITLVPIKREEADLILELAEGYFKAVNPEQIDTYEMEDKLINFYEDVRERLDVELFCPLYEKENIANIEQLLKDYE